MTDAPKQESRLGRGLGAMMSDVSMIRAGTAQARGGSGFIRVPVDRVVPESWLADTPVAEAELERLAESIRAHGVIDPVLVRKNGDDYALISGHARWRAAKRAGLADIPAMLSEAEGQDAFHLYLERKLLSGPLHAHERVRLRSLLQKLLGLPEEEALGRIPEPDEPPAPTLAPALVAEPARSPFLLVAATFLALLLAGFLLFFPRHPEAGNRKTSTEPEIETLAQLMGTPGRAGETAESPPVDRSWMRSFLLPGVTLEPRADSLKLVFEQGLFAGRSLTPEGAALLDRVAARIARSRRPLDVTLTGYGNHPWLHAALAADRLGQTVAADRIQITPMMDQPPYPATEAFAAQNQTVTITLTDRQE